ncbi:hypothetical protein [Bradyrhizobium sp.]|uniref:hypothetical protein n=1 Tax=Bradyrhizobium sp. TaxID=376 RepID=UPI00260B7116|nr:hypothetical protein [Bradyrhizobium sp.]
MRDGKEVARWIDWRLICRSGGRLSLKSGTNFALEILPWTGAESIPACFQGMQGRFGGENRAFGGA